MNRNPSPPGDVNYLQRLKPVLAPGWRALKIFWLPFVSIQLLAVGLVLAYYNLPVIAEALERAAVWKDRAGIFFPIISTGVAGALVPEVFKLLTGTARRWTRPRLATLMYSLIYFMISGLITWYFYQFQSFLFGTETSAGTVVCKVLFDMWVFTPLWAHPFAITWFLYRRLRYNLRLTFSAWGWPLYRDQVFPMLLPGWAYWFPMTGCIYSLPSPLQIPLFLFALSAWSLILIFLASDQHECPS